MRSVSNWAASALVAVTFLGAATAQAAAVPPTYNLTVLGTFGRTWSFATGISENGAVVGYAVDFQGQFQSSVNQTPFLYSLGVGTTLPVPAGLEGAEARGVNDSGVVVGRAYNLADSGFGPVPLSSSMRAIKTQGGVLTDLGGIRSLASAVNNAGVAAGRSRFGGSDHAALFDAGQVIDLGILSGSFNSSAAAINDNRVAAGTSTSATGISTAALFSQGQVIDIGAALGGGTNSSARGINNSGQVVGQVKVADGSRTTAFLYTNGTFVDLGTLGGLPFSLARDINNAGWIVGSAVYDDRIEDIPFLRIDGDLIDLNTLISPATRDGWLVSDANAINDRGQIAATALRDGKLVAVLLTPVPELPVPALLAAGLMVVLSAACGQAALRRRPD